MDEKGSVNETKRNCSEFDESSTLITIGSLNEQKFIEKLVKKYNTLSDRVWIGLEWSDNTFKWMDGSDNKYDNWDENTVKNGNNKCIQMSIIGSEFGKWTDDDCSRKYLMACQKKLANKNNLEKDLTNHTKIIESQQSRLDKLEKSSIPIGFLYTQFPSMSSPRRLWPSLQWTEVTYQYAGLFFRAVGRGSLPFGQTQQADQSSITYIETDDGITTERKSFFGCEIWKGNSRKNVPLDDWAAYKCEGNKITKFNIQDFYTTRAEVRPKNTAIKIWKRIE